MKVKAPGKLILSGEHAVVYGSPVLAIAVDRYITLSLAPQDTQTVTVLNQKHPLSTLSDIRIQLRKKYQAFLENEISIRQVLGDPSLLILFVLSLIVEKKQFDNGFIICLESNIPIGCGMGSSAAVIVSVLYAVSNYFSLEFLLDELILLGLEAENLQHGHSSGIDLRVSAHGGCIYLENKHAKIERREFSACPFYIVNTGTPITTTGECVAATANHFKKSKIGEDFTAVTKSIDQALKNDLSSFKAALRENHRLLNYIGAVPHKVQAFIKNIEESGGAAKICGAGAIAGDNGGIVLVSHDESDVLKSIASRFDYSIQPLKIEPRGVHVD